MIAQHVWKYMDHLLCLSCSFVILIAGADHLSAVSLIYLSMSLVFFVFPNRVNPKWIMHVVAVMFVVQYVFILGVRSSVREFIVFENFTLLLLHSIPTSFWKSTK